MLLYREGGSHTIWLNPKNHKIASVPRHREIKTGTVRAICRQLEIPEP
jgi:mRNA interferase HicA